MWGLSLLSIVLAGCAPLERRVTRACPGRRFVAESMSILKSHVENKVTLKANGKGGLQYYDSDGKYHQK